MKELTEVLRDWEAVIGLEIHTELTTLDTKMFCGCKLSHDDEPNTNVCPVCLGLPGALPVPNKRAIEYIVKAGIATNCEIQKHSMFYRKHYFYPDMAKNFQTTQGPVAFAMHGHLDLEVTGRGAAERPECAFGEAEAASLASASAGAVGLSADLSRMAGEGAWDETAPSPSVPAAASEGALAALSGYDTAALALPERHEDGSYTVPIRILRIHMEEDAAKMVHVGGEEGRIGGAAESLIDYNRCGTPLIELVTEPDLRTPEEARLFMEKLRRIFMTLGISDCSMEKGSMRCDGNVSLRRRGAKEFGVKTELKNMNSFKNLHDGLAYEICRQAEVLEEGGQIFQETRHWDPSAKRTIVMRVKETADDYRLFPDPDLAPYDLTDEWIDSVRAKLPELPDQKAARFEDAFGLSAYDARHLVEHRATADFFEACMELAGADAAKLAKPVANLVINDVTAYLNAHEGVQLADTPLTPARALALVRLTAEDVISSKQAKEVFAAVLDEDKDPAAVVEERGMKQVSDTGAIEAVVDAVLAANPDKVAQYQGGKTGLIGFFVGQCMKEMRGQGNPKLINELLAKKLG